MVCQRMEYFRNIHHKNKNLRNNHTTLRYNLPAVYMMYYQHKSEHLMSRQVPSMDGYLHRTGHNFHRESSVQMSDQKVLALQSVLMWVGRCECCRCTCYKYTKEKKRKEGKKGQYSSPNEWIRRQSN